MSTANQGVSKFVKSACDWPGATELNARERAAVAAHLTRALGYRQNSSNNYAENAVGAAAGLLFGTRASDETKREFAKAFWEAFPAEKT